jgi:hypothetical protein
VTSSSNLPNTSSVAVSAWVKPRGNNALDHYQHYLTRGTNSRWAIGKFKNSRDFRWYINTTGSSRDIETEVGFEYGKWYQIGFTYDAATGNWTRYVNGSIVGTETKSGDLSGSPYGLWVGTEPGKGESANATIDGIRIYDRALSPEKIRELYFYGRDNKFNGNYTTSKIDESGSNTWDKLNVNIPNLPGDADVSAVFRALDSGGSVVEKQLISLSGGDNNYTLNVQDSEDAEVFINGTSTNEAKSWEISHITVYYSSDGGGGTDPGAKVMLDKSAKLY